jgi:hypothetical protein
MEMSQPINPKTKKIHPVMFVILCCVCFYGCGILTSGPIETYHLSDQTYLTSFPEKAQCTIAGESEETVSARTPVLLNFSNLSGPMKIACTHEGYWTSNILLEPSDGKTLASRLIGRENITILNGGYNEADLGPQTRLPRKLHIVLRRNAFDTSEAKNSYYADEILYAKKAWGLLISNLLSSCKQQNDMQPLVTSKLSSSHCRFATKRLQMFVRNDLIKIEQERRRSSVE